MKTIFIILAFAGLVFAQDIKDIETIRDWKLIKEMSGDIPDHPGLTLQAYAAQIARGDNKVKVVFRFEFPEGAPIDVFKENVPHGFDVSSITRMVGKLELDCDTLLVRPSGGVGYIYQFNGKRHKTSEPPFTIESGNLLANYFCERGPAPTVAPTLKPPRN